MALKVRRSKFKNFLETTKGKTYSTLVITIVTALLLFIFAIMPAYMSITNRISENKLKKEYLTELDKKQSVLVKLADQKSQHEKQLTILEELYPNKSNDEFILGNIDSIAQRYGCLLQNIGFSEDATDSDPTLDPFALLHKRNINITFASNFANAQKFLNHLENFPAIIMIESFNYGIDEDAQDDKITNSQHPYIFRLSALYYFWDYSDE